MQTLFFRPWRRSAALALGWALASMAAHAQAPHTPAPDPAAWSLRALFDHAWQRQPEAQALPLRQQAAEATRLAAQRWTAEPPALQLQTRTDRPGSQQGQREVEVGLAAPLWLPGERARSAALGDAQWQQVQSQQRAAQLATGRPGAPGLVGLAARPQRPGPGARPPAQRSANWPPTWQRRVAVRATWRAPTGLQAHGRGGPGRSRAWPKPRARCRPQRRPHCRPGGRCPAPHPAPRLRRTRQSPSPPWPMPRHRRCPDTPARWPTAQDQAQVARHAADLAAVQTPRQPRTDAWPPRAARDQAGERYQPVGHAGPAHSAGRQRPGAGQRGCGPGRRAGARNPPAARARTPGRKTSRAAQARVKPPPRPRAKPAARHAALGARNPAAMWTRPSAWVRPTGPTRLRAEQDAAQAAAPTGPRPHRRRRCRVCPAPGPGPAAANDALGALTTFGTHHMQALSFTSPARWAWPCCWAAVTAGRPGRSGHDHGEAPAAPAGPALPRFAATSDLFELVGVLDGQPSSRCTWTMPPTTAPWPTPNWSWTWAAAPWPVTRVAEGEFQRHAGRARCPRAKAPSPPPWWPGTTSDLLAGHAGPARPRRPHRCRLRRAWRRRTGPGSSGAVAAAAAGPGRRVGLAPGPCCPYGQPLRKCRRCRMKPTLPPPCPLAPPPPGC
jgi:cobalt-zinc-cadmium efflux system outer membrane protein